MATKTRVSLEEFLAMPETEPPSELIEGEAVQKMAPNWSHSRLAVRLARLLDEYLERTREGEAHTEFRHVWAPGERVYLPDLSVTLRGRITPEMREMRPMPVQPDLAIEIVSPDDQPGRLLERADFYMNNGTRMLWLVDPETETVTVYRPGEQSRLLRAPGVLSASPVLREFELGLAELFAVLHEDED